VAASGLAFGWATWLGWLHAIGAHASYVAHSINPYLMPTIMASVRLAGGSLSLAYTIQACVGVAVAMIIWRCFRRGANDLSIAALQVGTFLATPYLFLYDMPMLANAILLYIRNRQIEGRGLGLIDGGIVAAGLLFPAVLMLTTRYHYIGSLALLALFGLIVWRRFEAGSITAPS
jgi:arabinofuranan 3-O-arabinosyltransferase